MSNSRRKLVLIDGSSYLFRAYFKLPELTGGADNHPTGAVLGVINMINKLMQDEKPDCFGVIFDSKGKNFRHEIYPEYKANRDTMPDELAVQIPLIFDIVKLLGYPLVCVDNIEADDVIATLARKAEKDGFDVLISTGDKDLAQLVTKNIELINTMEHDKSKARMDEDGVMRKFNVTPKQIPDYLALVGDTSDNIQGVPLVGPKKAAVLLAEYGDLKGIEKNADTIKGKLGENVRASIERFPLLLDLVTVRDNIKLDTTPKKLVPGTPDAAKLEEIYRKYDFKRWLDGLQTGGQTGNKGRGGGAKAADKSESKASPWRIVNEVSELDDFLKSIQAADALVVDAHFHNSSGEEQLAGLALSAGGEVVYMPLSQTKEKDCLETAATLKKLCAPLESDKLRKVGCGLKHIKRTLAQWDVYMKGVEDDVALMSYVYNSVATRHTLEGIASKYLEVFLTVPDEKDDPDVATLAQYYAARADAMRDVLKFFRDAMTKTPKLLDVYKDIEIPLLSVLADVEHTGCMVDVKKLNQYSAELESQINDLERSIYDEAGCQFNIASPKQLGEVLFDKLGLPPRGKTSTGQWSTNESVMTELAKEHAVPDMILNFRFLSKLKSTYTDRLSDWADKNGRVHTTFHQSVTATGRLSSSDPNLQNIPVRTDAGRRLRKCFIAPPKRCLIAADYSQIELRIMAHLSGDKNLCAAFARGDDVHAATASELFDIPIDKVMSDHRRKAKAINFGLIYGMTAFGLAKQIDIAQAEAQEYYDLYFERYSKVKKFIETTRTQAGKKGYVETVFGRRLYVAGINDRNAIRRRAAERAAINAPMQGTAADLIKMAMVKLHHQLTPPKAKADAATIILQVHDELIVETNKTEAKEVQKICVKCMESVNCLDVPLVVDSNIGTNWEEAH